MTLSISTPNKLGPAAYVYQVINIKTSKKNSDKYFLILQLLYIWPMLVFSQPSKLTSMYSNFKPANRSRDKNTKIKRTEHSPRQH